MLLVEDSPLIRQSLFELYTKPPKSLATKYEVPSFEVVAVGSGNEARCRLKEATENLQPFDVMVLDLALPTRNGAPASKDIGIGLFEEFDERAFGSVLVESVWADATTLIRLLMVGRAFFVAKPFQQEAIFRVAKQALNSTLQRLETQHQTFVAERFRRWTLLRSRAQTLDWMARTVSEGIGEVLDQTGRLAALIGDRFQLDSERDSSDSICGALADLKRAATRTSAKCAHVRTSLDPSSGSLVPMVAERVVGEVIQRLRDEVAFRRVVISWPRDGVTQVHSFPQDVALALEEILFNAIDASDEGQSVQVSVSRDDNRQTVNIAVVDETPPIGQAELEQIKDAVPISPDAGRAWGLSLAQSVAMNIGAKLLIEPVRGGGKSGNKYILQLPLTSHD